MQSERLHASRKYSDVLIEEISKNETMEIDNVLVKSRCIRRDTNLLSESGGPRTHVYTLLLLFAIIHVSLVSKCLLPMWWSSLDGRVCKVTQTSKSIAE